ncbi:MAG: type II secretion system protein [Deltaproteobacteria bacterium]|nr:type II secretion system protein [Deltaproteobacteria bacterium]
MIKSLHSRSDSGIGLIENLVSIAMMSIIIASASATMIMSFNSNDSVQTYSSVVSDVQAIIDDYRNAQYTELLDKFGGLYTDILDGESTTVNSSSSDSKADYQTILTAIKRSANSVPDALKVTIVVTHRRGTLGDGTYRFETVIAQRGVAS